MRLRSIHLLTSAALCTAGAFAQNDECTTALTIGANTPTPFDTLSATLSATPWACAGSTSPDIWFVFTAAQTAIHRFETCGSSYDTALQLFSGTCAALTSVGCNDDACGLSSRVELQLNAGDVRYIRVGGFGAAASGFGTLQVVPVIAQPVQLLGHYPMNDTGPTCDDVSGNNNAGFYSGGVQNQPGAAPGSGASVDFNGAGDHVEIPGAPAYDALLNDFTVMAWVKAEALPTGTTVMRVFGNQGPGGSWSFGLRSNLGLRFTTHAVLDYDQPASFVAGQWYHVAVSMDILNDVTFYVNGAPIGTILGAAPANTPNTSYIIGAWNPPGTIPEFFNGNIDDVQVYAGVLTGAQVQQLYNNPGTSLGGGSPICCGYCDFTPNSTGQPGVIRADGTNVVAANNVQLSAVQLPLNSFGFFLTSRTQGHVPGAGGSQGTLCLGGSIGRYVGPGQIQNSGQTGSFSLALNLAQTPTPTGFVSILPGENWNFQTWYRDSIGGAAVSNFTNGRSITFN